MQEILLGRTTEQAQNQLQNLAAITDRVFTSVKVRVIGGTMTEEHFVDLSERISLLSSVASDHAQKHGDLTHLRVKIGQKPVGTMHLRLDTIVNGLLDAECHRNGIGYIDFYRSNIEGLYIQKRLGFSQNLQIETYYLIGPAHLPLNRSQK